MLNPARKNRRKAPQMKDRASRNDLENCAHHWYTVAWLYSSQYHSADTVQSYFRKYHVKITGVVSAMGRRVFQNVNNTKVEKMIHEKYRQTLHIDNDMVMLTCSDVREPLEFKLSGAPETWSKEVVDVIGKIEKENEEAGRAT